MESRSSESRYNDYYYNQNRVSRREEIPAVIDYSGYASESRIGGESRSTYIGGFDPTPYMHYSSSINDSSSYSRSGGTCSSSSISSSSNSTCKLSEEKQRFVLRNTDNSSSTSTGDKDTYNNLESIDKLIERLESNFPSETSTNTRYNDAVSKRKKQIEELKELREEAKKVFNERKKTEEIEKENDEVDATISDIKKYIKQ